VPVDGPTRKPCEGAPAEVRDQILHDVCPLRGLGERAYLQRQGGQSVP
jgi:hypothetical protein